MASKVVHLSVSLPVLFLKEGKVFIAFSPALDLSASGSSIERAKKNFSQTLRLFVEELVEHGTLEQVLKDMGWEKHAREWQPPMEIKKAASVPFRVPVPA